MGQGDSGTPGFYVSTYVSIPTDKCLVFGAILCLVIGINVHSVSDGRKASWVAYMGVATGGDGGTCPPPVFSDFNITSMGVACKELTQKGLRPPVFGKW